MENQLAIIRVLRNYICKQVEGLTLEQLNKVPQGFNNSIAWNIGHMVAVQQLICYTKAGLPFHVEQEMYDKYKPDTKPQQPVDEREIATLKGLLRSTIDLLEKDYTTSRDLFNNYPVWSTRSGVEIRSIETGVNFLVFHEGLHIGYIMAMKHVI